MKELLLIILVSFLSTCWAKESVVISKCDLEPDSGFCHMVLKRFFYDPTINQCTKFFYNGCGGNANRFESKNDCERTCMHPPIEETADKFEGNDEMEAGESRKPYSRLLFGKPFQRTMLPRMELFKHDPLFDMFGEDEDEYNKEAKEEQTREDDRNGEEATKWYPRFANIFNLFKPDFDPFTKVLTGGLFPNIWSKTLNTFSKKIDRPIGDASAGLGEINVSGNTVQCYVCKKLVKMIDYELNILKLSTNHTLQTLQYICKLFPFAEKVCEGALPDIKVIITGIEEGRSEEDICKGIQMCRNSTVSERVTQSASITFRHTCAPLCNFIKVAQEEKVMKIVQKLNATNIKLKHFCRENKIIKKCDIFYRMVGTLLGHLSNIKAKKNEEHCKCFMKQPLFDTKKFDPCLRCKQFEKGMIHELKQVNISVLALASKVKGLCQLFAAKQACIHIVKELRNSLVYNSVIMPNICNVTGHCANVKKENQLDRLKESFGNLRGIIPNPYPFITRRIGVNFGTTRPGCSFCKECMGDLKETFKNINKTEVGPKSLYPAVKEGFSMYCQTMSAGREYTTVCRKISDGIETIHKVIARRDNGESMCKTLGVC